MPPSSLLSDNTTTTTTSNNNYYPSTKKYILHKGRINKGTILSYNGHGNLTIDNAQTYCIIHPNCIAFVYSPTLSNNNTKNILKPIPDNITFLSSINEIQYTPYGN